MNKAYSLFDYKSSQLFREEEMISRKIVTQIAFEKEFTPYARDVVNAVENAMEKLKEFRKASPIASRRRNVLPTNLNAFVVEELMGVNGIECLEFQGRDRRSYIDLESNRLFIKKIDKNLKPANIQTKAVRMYQNQKTTDSNDTLPITYLGYQVDKQWMAITNVYAVHMVEDTVRWCSDITALAYESVSSKKANLQIKDTEQQDISVKVGVKKKQAE